jgi:hypothetical protein
LMQAAPDVRRLGRYCGLNRPSLARMRPAGGA